MDVLLVDDSAAMQLALRRHFSAYPDLSVRAMADARKALTEARIRAFDLMLVDYHMPGMDGICFIRKVREIPHYAQVPIVMITSDVTDEIKQAALEAGATDFLAKRTRGVELTVRLRNFIRLASAVRRLEDRATWLAGEVERALRHTREREAEIIFRLALAVEYRDNDTGGHTLRVARYSQIMAAEMGLDPEFCRQLYLAAPLHDVGKVAVPDGILLKKGRLDENEFAVIRDHTVIGKRILGDSSGALIRLAAEIAEAHHEKWDGSGYPNGWAGEAIPLSARIVAVADVFDALTSERPYKEAMRFEEARERIRELAGSHFDPACVEAFLRRWDDIRAVTAAERGSDLYAMAHGTEPWERVPELLRELAEEPPPKAASRS
ncbi:HD-GYP domain-containing protein [Methylobacterium sp. WSM2598]|uniref:HD-GYP domain-containing protein n=1 Tax=Methylobacterium sp. WSM2598 TaxID=398261 RepID=UPI00037170DF|nr:HD domain-containing phosphohydrolase [Methylobacterium sp. WSM2598]